ncbi:MAG: hypothetical protein B7X93_04290 [Hydrogenophilales bacterium 17-61-9]|nr:MAG: hypothetical protein B7X93_04290 [Hydrogenophilales bacterium 17-61-9]
MSFNHPAFAPYRALIHALALESALPSLDRLNMLAAALGTTQARGLPLQFIAPDGRLSAREYETHILQTGQVPTRPDTWHDVLNALVWLRFPRFKAALNAAHGEALITEINNQRGRRRDAMTVLDESGVWVISQDPHLPDLLTACAWQTLFCERRADVGSMMHFVVVGHALLEKARAPYPSMTGKCLMLNSPTLDPDAVEQLAVSSLRAIESPRRLPPLPIQGIPEWDAENTVNAYYANQTIFRPRGAVL